MSRDVPGGTLTLRPMPMEKRGEVYAALPAFTFIASTVAINVFSAWLYDKLKKRPHPTRIIINRIETEITAGGIAKDISESITVEENKKA